MLKTDSFVTDILVIGSGIAGMIAAVEARKGGAEVTLASKGNLGKECSTSRASAFRAHAEETRGTEIPGYDNELGKHIEDWSLARTVIEEAPKQIENLIKLGVPMVKISEPANYRVEGSGDTHGGAIVLDILATVARNMGIRVVEGCQIVNLLKDEGRVVGASGLLGDGGWLSIYARAVVLATGGAAGMAEVTSTSREVCGNGYAMALKAGLPLKNVEFNVFFPIGLPTPTGQYVHGGPRIMMMEKALLRNDEGEDIIRKHFGISIQEGVNISSIRFDWLSRAVALEMENGKVWVDLTGVPPEEWDRLPEINWNQIRRTQVDMKKTPVPIMLMSHVSRGGILVSTRMQTRGGILVSTRMQTPLDGLYAAGEGTAGWMVGERGASNLPSCLTIGAIAGRNAVADIEGGKVPLAEAPDEGLEEARALAMKEGKVNPEEVGDEIRQVIYRHAGPAKSGASLEEGLAKLQSLQEKATDFRCTDAKELKEALDASAMLLAGQAIMKAALLRTESRANFYRKDFPTRDDEHWLRPVLVSYERETGEVTVEPGEKIALGGQT
jgi:succinate dehydrogenase/fumarate reductase flavoprotein subunit